MKNSIETKQLSKTYGNRRVVDGLNLHVPEGCVYGFLGPNGAGKSTTMKMLLGLIHPTGGSVRLLGEPKLLILDEPTNGLDPAGIQEMRQLIAEMPETTGAAVLISSHLLGEMEQMVTQVGILDHGRMLFEGALNELQKHSLGGYDLRLLDLEKGIPVLRKQGFSAQPDEKGRIPLPALPDAELARLSGLLAAGGAGVVGLIPKSRSLEEIFLSLTQHPQTQSAKEGEQ